MPDSQLPVHIFALGLTHALESSRYLFDTRTLLQLHFRVTNKYSPNHPK